MGNENSNEKPQNSMMMQTNPGVSVPLLSVSDLVGGQDSQKNHSSHGRK